MNPMIRFLRMSRWARYPPSPGWVALVLGVVALCLVLAGIEHLWGWPVWLAANRPLRVPGKF